MKTIFTLYFVLFVLAPSTLLSQPNLPKFGDKFEVDLRNHIMTMEQIYYETPPYDTDFGRAEKDAAKADKWLKKHSIKLNSIPIAKNYLTFLLGSGSYLTTSKGNVFRTRLCESKSAYEKLDLRSPAETNYLKYLKFTLNIDSTSYRALCQGAYLRNNPVACIECKPSAKKLKVEVEKPAELAPEVTMDTDGDGIVDEEDNCPEDAGLPSAEKEMNGCPQIIQTSTEPIRATPNGYTFKDSLGNTFENLNLGRVFEDLIDAGKLNTPFMVIEQAPKGSRILNQFKDQRVIYQISFLIDNQKKKLMFDPGDYVILEELSPEKFKMYKQSIVDFKKALTFLTVELGITKGVDLLVQGVADRSGHNTFERELFKDSTHDFSHEKYRKLKYYTFDPVSNLFIAHYMLVDGTYTNVQLPNLRGTFIIDVLRGYNGINKNLGDKMLLYEGVVTHNYTEEDRYATVFLAIDWDRVAEAGKIYENKLKKATNVRR